MPSNIYLTMELKLYWEKSEDRGMMDGMSKEWLSQWHLKIDSAGLLDQLSWNYKRQGHQILWVNWDLESYFWWLWYDHGIEYGYGWIQEKIEMKKHKKFERPDRSWIWVMKSVKATTESEWTKRSSQLLTSSENEGEWLRDLKIRWKKSYIWIMLATTYLSYKDSMKIKYWQTNYLISLWLSENHFMHC